MTQAEADLLVLEEAAAAQPFGCSFADNGLTWKQKIAWATSAAPELHEWFKARKVWMDLDEGPQFSDYDLGRYRQAVNSLYRALGGE